MALKQGPLAGIRVVEFAGIGPGPMCGMLLADMGAEVLLLERTVPSDIGLPRPRRFELPHRGKRSIEVDLKQPEGIALAKDLVAAADVLIEGFRPGTMERLGLGPDVLMALRPTLVYGRMTGYGQTGPMSKVAGHDLNYISLSGVLAATGRADQPPTPPLNLVGDYAGGAMSLALGIAFALVERSRSGLGQVIDASMVEGAALLMTSFFGLYGSGMHTAERGRNLLDSGAPFYDVYRCADGEYIAFAPIEKKFRAVFAAKVGLAPELLLQWDDEAHWPAAKQMLCALFATRSQQAWCALLEDTDSCVTPVLRPDQLADHRQNQARGMLTVREGIAQPAPAPRLSRTPGAIANAPPEPGEGGAATAIAWGIAADRLQRLQAEQVIGQTHASR